uniref:Dynamin_N domain-containing protein n=1 Tax=Parastrongyloides trichosuri TaxID=131310 RepID=A0A0N5A5J5_PARTI
MSFCNFRKKGPQLPPPCSMPSALEALYAYYNKKMLPIEELTQFNKITTPSYTRPELTGKPSIMFIGPYSTGKTTMINYLLNQEYKGSKIGPEPTTDFFTIITYGDEPKIIESSAILCMGDYQFKQVESFGQSFLNKFHQVECPSDILKGMHIIDTPGFYENTNESGTGVGYPYYQVLRYFFQRVEMIVITFDVSRLGSSIPKIMALLEPFKEKVRIVLNKSDNIPPDNALKVRENLLWQLAKTSNSYETPKIYYGSFWEYEYEETFISKFIKKDHLEFEKDINELSKNYKGTRIGQIQKRAKKLRFYYHLHSTILKSYFFVKKRKNWQKIITEKEFFRISKILIDKQIILEANLPPVDEWVNGVKKLNNIKSWKTVEKKLDDQLDEFLTKDISAIIACANQEPPQIWNLMLNRPKVRKRILESGRKMVELQNENVMPKLEENKKTENLPQKNTNNNKSDPPPANNDDQRSPKMKLTTNATKTSTVTKTNTNGTKETNSNVSSKPEESNLKTQTSTEVKTVQDNKEQLPEDKN